MIETLTLLSLALLWSLLSGGVTLVNLLVGALLGAILLSVIQRSRGRSFASRLFGIARFVALFVIELVQAGVAVVLLSIRPRPQFHPHVVAVPLRIESDAAISLLSATITLLPGTVAMGTSEDGRTLYAHAIGEADPESSRAGIRRIEELILGFMR